MTVYFNSQPITLTQDTTLEALLGQKNLTQVNGIAVALNKTVVQRSNWKNICLTANDEILVITATQGG